MRIPYPPPPPPPNCDRSAFPANTFPISHGLTKRELFAAMAPQKEVDAVLIIQKECKREVNIFKARVEWADALIAELERTANEPTR